MHAGTFFFSHVFTMHHLILNIRKKQIDKKQKIHVFQIKINIRTLIKNKQLYTMSSYLK